jgi:hypothetical protein
MNKKMLVELQCQICGRSHSVTVNADAYMDWLNGDFIQRAMPELSATEREQLISSICPKCQERIFGEDED